MWAELVTLSDRSDLLTNNNMAHACGALVVESGKLLLPSLREAVKLVKGVLYVPLADALYRDMTPSLSTSSRDLSLAAHTIRQAYFQVAQSNPNLDLRFILSPPSLHTSTPSPPPPSLQHTVDVVLSHMTSLSALGKTPSYQLLSQRVTMTSNDLYHMFKHLPLEEGEGEGATISTSQPPLVCYDHVVLGGTFDHMHTGHRLLLTESLLLSRKRLVVGVADGPLLASKLLPELIASCGERVEGVRGFLEDVLWSICHQVVPITDVYGPTAWDEDLQCLVVTTDTVKGGEMVNKERERKGLTQLDVHMVDLVGSKVSGGGVVNEDNKLSSSYVRRSLLGEYHTPPVNECAEYDPQLGPFLIGLTGAMATGKSTVVDRLVKKGAFAIHCDKLGHETYTVGGPAYDKIISEFGEGVRGEGGEINRRKLGAIVFNDKSKLDLLNSIVWPEIWRLVEVKVQEASSQGYPVCVVDAAVLVMAEWHRKVHEVWTTLCPQNQLISRVMERNRLSEEDATRRLAAQPPNQVYVDHAHIVICTQWELEVSGGQVERAWLQLMERINH